MNFNKHTWVTGEIVTARLLNRIEDALEELAQDRNYSTLDECDELFINFLKDEE